MFKGVRFRILEVKQLVREFDFFFSRSKSIWSGYFKFPNLFFTEVP